MVAWNPKAQGIGATVHEINLLLNQIPTSRWFPVRIHVLTFQRLHFSLTVMPSLFDFMLGKLAFIFTNKLVSHDDLVRSYCGHLLSKMAAIIVNTGKLLRHV